MVDRFPLAISAAVVFSCVTVTSSVRPVGFDYSTPQETHTQIAAALWEQLHVSGQTNADENWSALIQPSNLLARRVLPLQHVTFQNVPPIASINEAIGLVNESLSRDTPFVTVPIIIEEPRDKVNLSSSVEKENATEVAVSGIGVGDDHNLAHSSFWSRFLQLFLFLARGTGTSSARYSPKLQMIQVRYQDEVMLGVLVLLYIVNLTIHVLYIHGQAMNRSSVTYYADPRYHTNCMESHDIEDFLEEFNRPPADTRINIVGYQPHSSRQPQMRPMSWNGHVVFSFALDLSSWIDLDESPEENEHLKSGIFEEDRALLGAFLAENKNDLAVVEMNKEVRWTNFEELAFNIRQAIRQGGFIGEISVTRTSGERMLIHKNRQWANFMHSKAMKILCALSILGPIVYAPYMYLRCRKLVVRCRHRVHIEIENYWPLVLDHLHSQGLVLNAQEAIPSNPTGELSNSRVPHVSNACA